MRRGETMRYRDKEQANVRRDISDYTYSDDEVQFIMAMDRYKREFNRPFPALTEALMVIKSLGYRKVVE